MTREDMDLLTSTEGRAFLEAFRYHDLNALILNPPTKEYPEVSKRMPLFAAQIESHRKAQKKLPTWYQTNGIIYPPPLSLEQSSSEETANYKSHLVHGKILVDLTGGMGVDFSFLSRAFQESHYVERNQELCEVFRHNSFSMGIESITIHAKEAAEFAEGWSSPDETCFYMDPARRDRNKQKVFRFSDCEPNAPLLLPILLEKASTVLIKASPMLDLKQGLSELPNISEVHLVAVRNEMKEVLFLAKPGWMQPPTIVAINLKESPQKFEFVMGDEDKAYASTGPIQQFLLEPNVAILKSGAFKLISERFGLQKLDPNSHFYTNDKPPVNFPGRTFEVLNEVSKNNISRLLPEKKVNVISRNHPLTPEQIKKKYKLKDGGDLFLIGTRNLGKPGMWLCQLA